MGKMRRRPSETSLARYDWTRATRGRFVERFERSAHLVAIDPELWAKLGSADAVNAALRAAIALAEVVEPKRRRARAG